MVYKGGSALWLHPGRNREGKNREEQIIEILQKAVISELTQQLHSSAIIYRLDFNPGVLDNFFSGLATNDVNRPNYVAPRSLIIKYACDKIDNKNFSLESRVHYDIAKASSRDNIFPISPNYIHSEILGVTKDNKRTYSPIGKEFSALLRRCGLHTNLIAFLGKLNPNPLQNIKDYKETIIIMEMIAGVTLRQALYTSGHSTEPTRIIEKFYTFYLSGLLAKRGYSHGDGHSGNILVSGHEVPFITVGAGQGHNDFGAYLTGNRMNIVPYIIDFGRAARLDEMTLENTADCQSVARYYRQIYNSAVASGARGQRVKDIIDDYIRRNMYVEAVFITTMCRYIYPSLYKFKCEMGAAMYDVFFTVNQEQAVQLNGFLTQAINDRDHLESSHATTVQARSGGSVMRRIQYRSEKNKITPKTRKKKQIKLHKKKLHKKKTRKNRILKF
jgi:hypothetical protein